MMKRVLAGTLLSLLPALVLGQSLGEVARKERERRKSNKGVQVRTLSDQDIDPESAPATTPEEPPDEESAEEAPSGWGTAPPMVSPQPTAAKITAQAPLFTLEDRRGRSVSLSDYRGRTVLVDFWATWCGPCRASMPAVEKLHQRYHGRGLHVIGINIEGPSQGVLGYIDDGGYSFLFLFDEGNWRSDVLRSYGVRTIPRTFLIDRDGNVVYSGHPGRLSEALVEETLLR